MNDPYLHRFLVSRRDNTMWGTVTHKTCYAHKREIDRPTGLWTLLRWDTNGQPHPVAEFPVRDLVACVCLDDLDDARSDAFLTENVPPF